MDIKWPNKNLQITLSNIPYGKFFTSGTSVFYVIDTTHLEERGLLQPPEGTMSVICIGQFDGKLQHDLMFIDEKMQVVPLEGTLTLSY